MAVMLVASLSWAEVVAKPVKNVIFMIGDGMGMNQVYSAAWFQGKPLAMMSETSNVTFAETYSANKKVTDSAAGGTALSCGQKTKNYMVAMSPDSIPMETILEQAARNGKSTGVVVTCYLTHATPATFVAHQIDRGMLEEIAQDFLKTTPDVTIGGGKKYFEARKDGLNLSDSLRAKGLDVVYTLEDAENSSNDRVFALLADEHLPKMTEGRGDALPKSVDLAIRKLSKNKKGFFLMVEGSQIDMRCHSNDIEGSIAETLDFDKAVEVALDFARRDGNTLVVVTADHETGGLSITQTDPYKKETPVKVKYTVTGHTGVPVPVFAYGPGAENYQKMMDNTEHKGIIAKLMGLK